MPDSAEDGCPRCGGEVIAGDEERFCRNVRCDWWEPYPGEHDAVSGEQFDGREGTHYYGDACLGGHGELADIEAAEAEHSDGCQHHVRTNAPGFPCEDCGALIDGSGSPS
jgi:predicted RNA-binding Zn-ribbon protein involved in translation (DUF1610 family)